MELDVKVGCFDIGYQARYEGMFQELFWGKTLASLHGWRVTKHGEGYFTGKVGNRGAQVQLIGEDGFLATFVLTVEDTNYNACGFDLKLIIRKAPQGGLDYQQKIVKVAYAEDSRYTRNNYWEAFVTLTLTLEDGMEVEVHFGDADHDAIESNQEYSYRIRFESEVTSQHPEHALVRLL